MTATLTETRQTRPSTQVASTRRPSAEDMLRDVAFALRLARRTAQAIHDEAAGTKSANPARPTRLPASLVLA
jgi:hypothetical protein